MEKAEKVESYTQNPVKLAESIVYEAISDLNEENVSDYYYHLGSVEAVVNEDNTITIEVSVEYAMHFFEISEAVSESLQYALADNEEELSEEELEKMFEEAYNDQLEEINDNYMIPLDLEATLDLSSYYIHGGVLKVRANPIGCDGDFCNVGLSIDLKLERIPIDSLINATSDIKTTIKTVIERVAEFHRI